MSKQQIPTYSAHKGLNIDKITVKDERTEKDADIHVCMKSERTEMGHDM